ncbi:cellulose binding iron reductase-like protein [Lindgomyces ingoldianus]|uniref:Cellulose binding iron reductase-like protein n=1 Tax=Lindgomyces ingoldianus TaxID=673940 RepID=A0ACB6QKM8_9PLEO|nr:cellulose binding iron reductase-like protein [Lindgomyces ingoldianus]KAF2467548.1 cellulose binding iron reductase-like protein [Lindgomyces ingoldianus]
MRSIQLISSAVAFAGHVYAQVDSKVSCDSVTKICFSTYTNTESGMSFGIALPSNVTDPYDAIISITAPVKNTWAGFAWGGTMVWNPLTIAWPNGKTSIPSSRFAFGISLPLQYDGAEYTLMKGTTANSTHYTMVARCRGCTGWQSNEDTRFALNGTGTTQFAWAFGTGAVEQPSSNTSAFNVHEAFGKWIHDLNAARSSSFNSWVANNLLEAPAATSSVPKSTTRPTTIPSTIVTSVKPSNTPTVKASIPASCSGAGSAAFSSVLASGWKATKVLGGLTSPRSIVFDSAGNMLVVQSGKGISYHAMSADGCSSSTKMLISLNSLNHGIAFSPDGKTLYASSMTQAYSWPYDATAGSVGTRTTVITGMYNGGAHLTRTLLVAPHKPNLLVVSHGSNDNFDTAAGNPKTGRAIIKVFDLSAMPSGGYNYVSGGWNAGYGQRNEVGITFDGNNMLWGVENSGDNFKRTVSGNAKDIHQNNPSEKLHYMGDVTKPNDNWYGYPTCFTVWQPSDFTDKTFKVGDWFVVTPNSTFGDDTCNTKAVAPALTFMPHSAPIDSKFDETYSNLYVTFHGSWNRQPTTGFKLVVVPFTKGSDGAYKPVAPLSSNSGYTDVMTNPDVTRCSGNGPSMSSGCFRPAGLSFDKSGRLYMTSDTSSNGEVWVLGKSLFLL